MIFFKKEGTLMFQNTNWNGKYEQKRGQQIFLKIKWKIG